MPHRTKLIIPITLLVLCAITVAAVVITWAPPKPLRFHVTKCEVVSNAGQPDQIWKVSMVAKNTSLAPVHLLEADFRTAPSGAYSRKLSSFVSPKAAPKVITGRLEFDPKSWPASSPSVMVSSGSSIECVIYVTSRRDAIKWLPDAEVSYCWISYTASKAEGLLRRLRKWTPDMWRSHLPTRLFQRESVAIEPPPGMQLVPKP